MGLCNPTPAGDSVGDLLAPISSAVYTCLSVVHDHVQADTMSVT